jgi:hypothetical protein
VVAHFDVNGKGKRWRVALGERASRGHFRGGRPRDEGRVVTLPVRGSLIDDYRRALEVHGPTGGLTLGQKAIARSNTDDRRQMSNARVEVEEIFAERAGDEVFVDDASFSPDLAGVRRAIDFEFSCCLRRPKTDVSRPEHPNECRRVAVGALVKEHSFSTKQDRAPSGLSSANPYRSPAPGA